MNKDDGLGSQKGKKGREGSREEGKDEEGTGYDWNMEVTGGYEKAA